MLLGSTVPFDVFWNNYPSFRLSQNNSSPLTSSSFSNLSSTACIRDIAKKQSSVTELLHIIEENGSHLPQLCPGSVPSSATPSPINPRSRPNALGNFADTLAITEIPESQALNLLAPCQTEPVDAAADVDYSPFFSFMRLKTEPCSIQPELQKAHNYSICSTSPNQDCNFLDLPQYSSIAPAGLNNPQPFMPSTDAPLKGTWGTAPIHPKFEKGQPCEDHHDSLVPGICSSCEMHEFENPMNQAVLPNPLPGRSKRRHSVPEDELAANISRKKPKRFEWSQALHQHFITAYDQISNTGNRPTSKNIMLQMEANGAASLMTELTRIHVNTHLQKYVLGIDQKPKRYSKFFEFRARKNDNSP